MAERLIECVGCSRHVKSCDAVCPFCGAIVRSPLKLKEPYRRMTAAAAVAAGVASLVGCSDATRTSSTPFYGGSGVIVEADDAGATDAADAAMDVAVMGGASADSPEGE